MTDLPIEFYGVPMGAAIMLAVAALERAGLPSRFAGLVAIMLGTVIGAAVLWDAGQPMSSAAIKGFIYGLAIVATHKTVIDPIKG